MRRLLPLLLLAGCVTPPMGLGMGPGVPSVRPGSGLVGAAVGVGAGPGRQTFQAEAQLQASVARWFALELGGVYAQLSARDDAGRTLSTFGGFPYLRPRFTVRHVTLAVAVSGFAFGGGGGGIAGGVADAQLGYGRGAWSGAVGAMAQGFELVGDPTLETSSRQLRLGGAHSWQAGGARVGVGVDLYWARDDLRRGGARVAGSYVGAGLKVTITSPELR